MNLPNNPTLKDIQSHLDFVCKEKGWDKNSITEVFLLLTEEVGELAKSIRRQTGFKGEKRDENQDNIEEEIADVFNYLLEVCNRFDISLEDAYKNKHQKNEHRVWE